LKKGGKRMRRRSRKLSAFLTVLVMLAGLTSRRIAYLLPEVITTYLGDVLWALMIFLGIAFLFPKLKTSRIWLIALLFCWFIEVTQLYHAPWLDAIRETTIGGLVLGFGFLWSDILAYTIGTLIGVFIDRWLLYREK
jgi:hypothetical protein